MARPGLEDKAFLLLVAAVTLAFAWILWPVFDALLWGTIIAIVFAPVYRCLCRSMRQRRTPAALATVVLVVVIVIVPVTLVAAMLAQEATGLIERIQSGELNPGRMWRQAFGTLPAWVLDLLNRFGLGDLDAVQQRITAGLLQGSRFIASQAVNIGQVTVGLLVGLAVMLYLLFFLLRDSDSLLRQLKAAIPLRPDRLAALAEKFTVVIRATVKGNIVVAIVQGALGGLIFWLLGIHGPVMWAVVMAVLSLLPAVGAALVWLPVAIYLLATGSLWEGVGLIAYGVLVIGLVDNVLRPLLVGKDTRMPDYVVLISTLGGIAIFGINGFVIGPVIAAMFIAVWGIFAASRNPP